MVVTRLVVLEAMICAVAMVAALAPPPGRAAAQPQPTLVLSPSSGPCDATLQVTAQDFPANAAIELGVGGTDGQLIAGHLGSVLSDADGRLSLSTLLGFLGCGMAGVTKERTGGDQLWLLGYVLEAGPYGPTARILARARYTFTTTESTLPIAVLTLSPSGGPCDATVEATGALFEPGSDVALQVARPDSEGFMGTLGRVRADANGGFTTTLTLGTLACEAAALHAAAGQPKQLQVCGAAYQASRCATYAPTTTVPAGVAPASALPSAGHGGTSPRMDIRPPAMVAGLLGVLLLLGGLLAARRRSS
jgi:hypothetical protein